MLTVREGFDVFCLSPFYEWGIDEARSYVKKNNLTSEDVKIVKTRESVIVRTKREIEIGEGRD